MYNEGLLTDFMVENGMRLLTKTQQYLGTPYAYPENDIIRVAEAISLKRADEKIDFQSPSFYDNMLTLAYKKDIK